MIKSYDTKLVDCINREEDWNIHVLTSWINTEINRIRWDLVMQIETDDNLFCHFSDRLVVGVIVSGRMIACDMAEKIKIKKIVS